jgi:hypothetical protein
MPVAGIGQSINLGGKSQFIRLKKKGDKIQFRLANGAVYEGKHFSEENGEFTTTFCPRVMTQGQEKCATCEMYFDLRNKAKEEKDENKKKALQTEASKKYGVKISFYFPVVDRTDGKAKVLQTSLSVRTKLESMVESGVNILDADFVLLRTENAGADYYSLVRLDSKDTKPLSKEENEEFEKAKVIDIEGMLGHKTNKSSMQTGA